MHLIVNEKIQNYENIQQIKQLCNYAFKYSKEFLNLSNNLTIELSKLNYPYRGYYLIKKNKIVLNIKQDLYSILNTLCHELIHAEQHFRGCLNMINEDIYWRNKRYKLSSNINDYLNFPWEIEAHNRDKILTNDIYTKIVKGYI